MFQTGDEAKAKITTFLSSSYLRGWRHVRQEPSTCQYSCVV